MIDADAPIPPEKAMVNAGHAMKQDEPLVAVLKPCPRCGGKGFVTIHNEVWCTLDMCLKLPPRASKEEAIAAWNTRTVTPVERVRGEDDERFACVGCGEMWDGAHLNSTDRCPDCQDGGDIISTECARPASPVEGDVREALEPFARVWAVAFRPFDDGRYSDDPGIADRLPKAWPQISDLRRAYQVCPPETWTFNNEEKPAALSTPTRHPDAQVREALVDVDADYMTSEQHHPDYVLIPTAKFEQLCAARAVLAALPPADGGWQGIESAPKDGTRIDLWAAGKRRENCRYDRYHGWIGPRYAPTSPAKQPTHWRPLPPPPLDQRTGEEG